MCKHTRLMVLLFVVVLAFVLPVIPQSTSCPMLAVWCKSGRWFVEMSWSMIVGMLIESFFIKRYQQNYKALES